MQGTSRNEKARSEVVCNVSYPKSHNIIRDNLSGLLASVPMGTILSHDHYKLSIIIIVVLGVYAHKSPAKASTREKQAIQHTNQINTSGYTNWRNELTMWLPCKNSNTLSMQHRVLVTKKQAINDGKTGKKKTIVTKLGC